MRAKLWGYYAAHPLGFIFKNQSSFCSFLPSEMGRTSYGTPSSSSVTEAWRTAQVLLSYTTCYAASLSSRKSWYFNLTHMRVAKLLRVISILFLLTVLL